MGDPLISIEQKCACLSAMGRKILPYYEERCTLDSPLVVCAVADGGLTFAHDLTTVLAKQTSRDANRFEYEGCFAILQFAITIKSHDKQTRSLPRVCSVSFARSDIYGRHILIVDDVFDSGRTAQKALETISTIAGYSKESAAKFIRIATFLKKPRSLTNIQPNWFGFDVSDHFLVGYGMDYENANKRFLPAVYISDDRPSFDNEPSWAYRFDYIGRSVPVPNLAANRSR